MKALMDVVNAENIQLRLTAIYTLEEWNEIIKVLKGNDQYYGPVYNLQKSIEEITTKFNETFHYTPKDKSNGD